MRLCAEGRLGWFRLCLLRHLRLVAPALRAQNMAGSTYGLGLQTARIVTRGLLCTRTRGSYDGHFSWTVSGSSLGAVCHRRCAETV